jgi:hypothetical protein
MGCPDPTLDVMDFIEDDTPSFPSCCFYQERSPERQDFVPDNVHMSVRVQGFCHMHQTLHELLAFTRYQTDSFERIRTGQDLRLDSGPLLDLCLSSATCRGTSDVDETFTGEETPAQKDSRLTCTDHMPESCIAPV